MKLKNIYKVKKILKIFFFSKMSNINHYTGDLIIPFIQLLPFIKDDKVMKIYRTAQYNKSITKILIRCIATANSSVSITRMTRSIVYFKLLL